MPVHHPACLTGAVILKLDPVGLGMSALGHKQTSRNVRVMSALPPKADIRQREWRVRYVPKADINTADVPASFDPSPTAVLSSRYIPWRNRLPRIEALAAATV
jgi:hypothetical protein